MDILAVCGSLRARSLNAAVLRAAAETAPGRWNVAMESGLARAWACETLRVMGASVLGDGLEVPAAAGKIVDGRLIDEPTRAELRKALTLLDEAVRDVDARA